MSGEEVPGGGGGHAAEANAFASANMPQGVEDGRSGSTWGAVLDRLQAMTSVWGFSYDMDTTLGDKAGRVCANAATHTLVLRRLLEACAAQRGRRRSACTVLTRPFAEQMVYAHRRTLDQDRVILFVAAACLAMLLAGFRLRRSTETSNKFVSLILSFMWASQAVLMFGESCPSAGYLSLGLRVCCRALTARARALRTARSLCVL
jgi:hypothetical protein